MNIDLGFLGVFEKQLQRERGRGPCEKLEITKTKK